jgi:hypothetical protein
MSFYNGSKDCESAYNVITNPESDVFDIALDISMPPYEDKGIYSGEDGKLLLEFMPPKLSYYNVH